MTSLNESEHQPLQDSQHGTAVPYTEQAVAKTKTTAKLRHNILPDNRLSAENDDWHRTPDHPNGISPAHSKHNLLPILHMRWHRTSHMSGLLTPFMTSCYTFALYACHSEVDSTRAIKSYRPVHLSGMHNTMDPVWSAIHNVMQNMERW